MTDATVLAALRRLLAGTMILQCKVRFFAWALEEKGDDAIALAVWDDTRLLDDLCTRFAAHFVELGGVVSSDLREIERLSSIKSGQNISDSDILPTLVSDHAQLASDARFVKIVMDGLLTEATNELVLETVSLNEHCGTILAGMMKG